MKKGMKVILVGLLVLLAVASQGVIWGLVLDEFLSVCLAASLCGFALGLIGGWLVERVV